MKKFFKRLVTFVVIFFFYVYFIEYFDFKIFADDTIQPSSSNITAGEQTAFNKYSTYFFIAVGVVTAVGLIYFCCSSPVAQPVPVFVPITLPAVGEPSPITVPVRLSLDNVVELQVHLYEYANQVDLTRYQAGSFIWTQLGSSL